MGKLPDGIFIVDPRKERIAVHEARKLGIPIVAIVDTNCNPDKINYPIPGNDDAIRAINLFTQIIANAVIEAENEVGLEIIETLQDEGAQEEEFSAAMEKGEFADYNKYEGAEVETVAVGATLGGLSEEEQKAGFTDKDYSDYEPEKEAGGKPAPVKQDADLADKHKIDEDKLYEE
jgi:small subunit ribosomal protein S2